MEIRKNRRVGEVDGVGPNQIVVIINVLVVVLINKHVILQRIAHLHSKLASEVHVDILLVFLEIQVINVLLKSHIIQGILLGVSLVVNFRRNALLVERKSLILLGLGCVI